MLPNGDKARTTLIEMMSQPKSDKVGTKSTDYTPEALPSDTSLDPNFKGNTKPPMKNPCPSCKHGLGRDSEDIHDFLCMNQFCELFVNRFDNYKIKLRKK